ncbi:TBC1 domain family member 15-like isoform X1 [Cynara cardunculus var. scolymus]|uniref:TBC1 domain family member 15-like isoform X1 n=1 Tax=Cynara cardunculus var. scolymus TaxID=59895 RepID=UPI000D6286A7|nr:TBC1 domain family member 15-like isoform X1 [Cynara cardunculus var. scolymus]
MFETEIYDLSDDADYAAASQQGPSSMAGHDISNRSYSSEPENAEIVYLKDNVTIHPTQYATERISGRLKLIKQDSLLFMSWIPYKGQSSNARLSERDKNLYTIRAVSFADIRSIRRHTPTIGWQYVIVVLSSGLAFPPLYFYNGGVREFIATVKQHIFIVRSSEDANVFLVNNLQDPLQRTLSSLELPRTISIAKSASSSSFTDSPSDGNLERLDGGARKKGSDTARDISIQVLEKFSLVTRFARETTSQLFRESLVDDFGTNENKKRNQSQNRPREIASNDVHVTRSEVPVPPDPLEFDKLSLVWGKPRQPPLGPEEWATFLDSEGRVEDLNALRKRIFYGGVEHSLRKEIWAFLLGYHAHDSTYAERQHVMTVKKSEYETIKNQWQSISPEQAKRFTKFRERKGLIERDAVRTDRSLLFYEGDENPNVYLLRDILLTYSFYNFDLGYCQGMSDLLSPIVFVMEDESESFWCFVSLMERLGPNFNRDQNGMHSQLFALSKLVELLDSPLHNYFKQKDCLNYFFCFRWILIQFKREFEFDKILRLWEVLWTHHVSEHLHLYICIAILKRHRAKIMREQMSFDTLLKFINELSGCIDLDAVVCDAEALCVCAGENGVTSIPPGTPPSLPVEDESIYQQDNEAL